MNRMPLVLFIVLIALTSGNARLRADDPDGLKKLARFREIRETVIDTRGFPEEMPLSKFLAALRRQLPGEKKIALRLEENELGKEACRLADAPVRCAGHRATLRASLEMAMQQVKQDVELNYDIRDDGIVITRASSLAMHSCVHNVADVVLNMPSLLPYLKHIYADRFADMDTTDGMALLVRYLIGRDPLRSQEKLDILDGTRLTVRASIHNQAEVIAMLEALRRMSDEAVIMNARLYEVDRDFFRKHVAPLFAEDGPAIATVDDEFLKKIVRHKLIQESEDRKLRPNEKSLFLGRHSVFRFDGGRKQRTGTGLAGVSFEVRPMVSADRRYLRLYITQHVAQLVGIDKSKVLDLATGKDETIEVPNVRKSAVSGTVQILDAGAILMPVRYRPDGDDRVWLLVARPFIWIEEEQKERGPGNQITSKDIWSMEVPKEEEAPAPPAGKPLSLDDDGKAILQAVLTNVLTNPSFAGSRKFYGTPADKTVALVDGEKIAWPKDFALKLHDWKAVEPVHSDPFYEQHPILGIRVDKFDLKNAKSGPFHGSIQICLFNAGGCDNDIGRLLGSCTVDFRPRRDGKRWIVECLSVLDP